MLSGGAYTAAPITQRHTTPAPARPHPSSHRLVRLCTPSPPRHHATPIPARPHSPVCRHALPSPTHPCPLAAIPPPSLHALTRSPPHLTLPYTPSTHAANPRPPLHALIPLPPPHTRPSPLAATPLESVKLLDLYRRKEGKNVILSPRPSALTAPRIDIHSR